MITTAEREGLDKGFTTHHVPTMPAKGQSMDHTTESWKYLAELYANSLLDMKDEISFLKRKINKLEQKGGQPIKK